MQWDGEEKCYLIKTWSVQRVLESPLNARDSLPQWFSANPTAFGSVNTATACTSIAD